jgi:hypothetical protein
VKDKVAFYKQGKTNQARKTGGKKGRGEGKISGCFICAILF